MEKLKRYFYITGGDEECSEIIGIKVAREADGSIVLSAPVFIKNLLEAQGLGSANGSRYPDDKSTVPAGRVLDSKETSNYRAVVGSLRWLERTTFPVLAHAVNTASRFLQKPHSGNWIAVKRILRFLANKQHMGCTSAQTGLVCLFNLCLMFILTAQCWGSETQIWETT